MSPLAPAFATKPLCVGGPSARWRPGGRHYSSGSKVPGVSLDADQGLQARVLHEAPSQLCRTIPPVDTTRQDDATGALAVQLRLVDSRRQRAVLAQGPRGGDHATTRADDQLVGRAEVLARAVVDRPHAMRDRHVLGTGAAG